MDTRVRDTLDGGNWWDSSSLNTFQCLRYSLGIGVMTLASQSLYDVYTVILCEQEVSVLD